MRADIEIILQHGWGFDARIWDSWLSPLSRLGSSVIIHSGERGYYNNTPLTPCFLANSSYKIIVGHSLGLHLVHHDLLSRADAIISLCGFLAFHPQDQLANKRSKRLVRTMKDKLYSSPQALLSDFLKQCYADEFTDHGSSNSNPNLKLPLLTIPPDESLHIERLSEDLELLDGCDWRSNIDSIAGSTIVRLLHGTADRIVSPDKSLELSTLLPQAQAKVLLIEHGSHALPVTHTALCIEAIKEILMEKREAGYANLSS